MTKVMALRLICGWCREEFKAVIMKDKWGDRNILICPHCARTLPSSKKEFTGSLGKHIHTEWRSGDVI